MIAFWVGTWTVAAMTAADRAFPVVLGALALALSFLLGLNAIAAIFSLPGLKSLRGLTGAGSSRKWPARFYVYAPGILACGLFIQALAANDDMSSWTAAAGFVLVAATVIGLTCVVAADRAPRRTKALSNDDWLLIGLFLCSTIISLLLLVDGIRQFL
jgi:predicted lysophospholipase L1 biosynthesis ABC-type transport system permease subunit